MTAPPPCGRCRGPLARVIEYNEAGKIEVVKCLRCGHRVAERVIQGLVVVRPEKKPKPDRVIQIAPAKPRVTPLQEERILTMSNKLSDLNNHLFAQLDRLAEKELAGEALQSEIDRTRAITGVAKEIIANGKLALEAQVALGGGGKGVVPGMLQIEDKADA